MDLEKLKFSILIIKHNNMKKTSFLILLSLSVSFFCSGKKSAVDYVNPMIGTALKGEGGTSPFVGTPFAMTEFMPQTRENKMGTMAYVYDDKSIMGFLASHQPYGWEITATSL